MQKLVSIGIPVYKKKLNEYEKISLQQLERILGNYPKIFIAPQSLEFNYGGEYEDWGVERFPDEFFQGTTSYSRLCLSINFYKRFDSYKFLLIYQLDAFVFSDRLEEFCAMDYDYIGAPWDYFTKMTGCKSYVGNGGFSLRKIKSVIALLKTTKKMRMNHRQSLFWNQYEDRFFSFCAGEKINGFHAPQANLASWFSVDLNVRRWWIKHHKKLSFGCHDWQRKDSAFYLPIIKEYGYKFNKGDLCEGNLDEYIISNRIVRYLCERSLRERICLHIYFEKNKIDFLHNGSFCLFGSGKDGKLFLKFLQQNNVSVACFLDSRGKKYNKVLGVPVIPFNEEFIKKNKMVILISTGLYRSDIIKLLADKGLIIGKDYIDLIEFLKKPLKSYFCNRVFYKIHD